MPEGLAPDTFEPHVGTRFDVRPEARSELAIELHELTRLPPRSYGDRREPFSLVFLGPAGAPLPQGIYTMHHDALGDIDLFIVPIGPGVDGRNQYEAVFN
ncbi:MAG TPA: hypothetical protein VGC84_00420 [Ilumatobacteraceae bacterium]|jgi:hypothetical protein